MKYFIADTHFFHKNVLEFSDRPFKDVEEMNQQLIKNWNSVVKNPKDEVYILGDFVYKGTGKQANEVQEKLRGKKYLIKGNHESYLKEDEFDSTLFEWVKDYHSFKYNKKKLVLFHYPILEWDGFFNGSIHLYGHVHNTRIQYFNEMLGVRALNVGADMLDYKPISIDEVFEIVRNREELAQ